MGQLVLLRHGQAAAFTDDPDRLTELGMTQARRAGAHLAQLGVRFDLVVHGELRRQRQTAEQVALAYREAGVPLPTAELDAAWNEYDHGLVGALTTLLERRDAEFAKLAQAAREAFGGAEQNRYFQRAFEVAMNAWADGEVGDGGFESFEAFTARVLAARDRVRAADKARVLVCTSGGPIGLNVAAALSAPPRAALHVNYRVRNASLTEFLFSGTRRLSLDGFNAVPHLEHDPGLVTYR